MEQPETIAEAVMRRADDSAIGLIAGDLRLTHAEVVAQAARRPAWLRAHRSRGPFHVAVLLVNMPEFIFWLEAAPPWLAQSWWEPIPHTGATNWSAISCTPSASFW